MKATAIEFRFRFAILVLIYVLGFLAPWDFWLHLDGSGPNAHVWGQLAGLLSGNAIAGIGTAFDVVLSVGIACAIVGAWLRVWGSAYLGAGVVKDTKMLGDAVVADGPYRYLRNPLYLGTFVNTLAVALLMRPTGAIFTIVLVGAFQMRLILGEEAFLSAKLGAQYAAYCALVPRLAPSLRPKVAASGLRPHWLQAILGEIYVVGVAASFAVLGWWYNALLLTKCVLVWLGVSLVVRAAAMKERPAADRDSQRV